MLQVLKALKPAATRLQEEYLSNIISLV